MTRGDLVADASALVLAAIDTTDRGDTALAQLHAATVHAPHLVDVEVGSALRRMVLRSEIGADDAVTCRRLAADLIDFRYPHHPALCDCAWDYRAQLTFYDAQYAALATVLGFPLLTADARIGRAPVRGLEVEVC